MAREGVWSREEGREIWRERDGGGGLGRETGGIVGRKGVGGGGGGGSKGVGKEQSREEEEEV